MQSTDMTLTPNEINAALGISVAMIWAVALVLFVLQIIAYWKIFEKAGESGWKALIPVYNEYTLYKIAWNKNFFWAILIISAVMTVLAWIPILGMFVSFIGGIAAMVIEIFLYIKLAKAFGYGGGFAVGLILLNTIFTLILGFDKSEYIGPQE